MFENLDIIITLFGGFIAVIGLQINLRSEIKDVKAKSDANDEKIDAKLAGIQREFDLCRNHCKVGAKE